MRTVGTVSRGVRCPVIRQGDDLVQIVTDAILACQAEQSLTFQDRDIVAVTEAVVARAQGNYASIDAIAQDCRTKFGVDTVGLTFPILSRNRIAICLKGVAKAFKKAYIQFSYPADEVGNHLFDEDLLDEKGVNPWSDVLDEKRYRELQKSISSQEETIKKLFRSGITAGINLERMKNVMQITALDRTTLISFVKRILVYEDKRVYLELRYKELFSKMLMLADYALTERQNEKEAV